MKHLLTLTLVAVLGFAVIGCNKTTKVNASATAAQCDGSNCDPANCDKTACATKCAKLQKAGTAGCPIATAEEAANSSASDADKRARRARYQAASDKMLKMVEAGEITQAEMEARLNRMKKAMASNQAKPAAAGTSACCASKGAVKPAAASTTDCPLAAAKSGKTKPAAAGKPSCCSSKK